jgi:hypothetical protein
MGTVLVFFVCFFATLRSGREVIDLDEHDPCGNCGYDRSGLGPGALCPECGTLTTRRPGRRRLVYLRPGGGGIALASCGLMFLYFTAGWVIAEGLVVLSYLVAGYALEVSRWAARSRELGSGESIDFFLWPLGVVIAASPLIALSSEERRPRAWAVFGAFAAAGLLGCVLRWVLPFAHWGSLLR